jgi:membrane associated rhomboid family serine protease
MRRRPEPENKLQTGLKCVYALIAVNAALYIFTLTRQRFAIETLWLSPDQFRGGMLWQPLTAMFMHGGLTHILFNMWALYIFGGIVAPRLGGRAFLTLYLSTGLLGNLIWLAAAWTSPAVLCGASGAVMAVTAAAAVMAPETPMLLLFIPFPIKLRTMAVVFFALELVMEFAGGQPGVANLVHIVGFIGGYLFIKFFFRREMLWDPLSAFFGRRGYRPPRNNASGDDGASGWTYRRSPDREPDYGPNFSAGSNFGFNGARVSQRELDYLLDKISRSGINSLTEQELQRLKQAREEMRRS